MIEMKENWGWTAGRQWYLRVDETHNMSSHSTPGSSRLWYGARGHVKPFKKELGAKCFFFPKEYLT